MTIGRRLLITYLALIALGMSLVAGYVLWSFRAYFVTSETSDLTDLAVAFGESVADAMERGEADRVELLTRRYGAPPRISLRVLSPEGRLIATSDAQQDWRIKDWLIAPGVRSALAGQQERGVARGLLSNDERIYVAQPIFRNGRQLGVVRISLTLTQFEQQFQEVLRAVTLATVIAFVLCTLISIGFADSLASPIRTMRDFAVQLGQGQGNFGRALAIYRPDELGDLARELNRMSSRLAALDDERRSFLANVSHELRTPISNVKVTLEALQSGAAEDEALRERFLAVVYQEIERLRRLIDDLLDLGRLEAGVSALEVQPVDLRGLVNRAVQALEPRLAQRNVACAVEVDELVVNIDPERMLQALLNLLDNALKHSNPGTAIAVVGRAEGRTATLAVADRGSGISQQDLPHIFEQFYSADRSRRRGSTGLGLAITRRIVEAHGGTITVRTNPGQGSVFTISLPRQAPRPELPPEGAASAGQYPAAPDGGLAGDL